MKKLRWALMIFAGLLLSSCVSTQIHPTSPQEFVLKIQADAPVTVKEDQPNGQEIVKTMVVKSDELTFSENVHTKGDTAYTALCGTITQYDLSKMWHDYQVMQVRDIKKLVMFLNSPGGSAWEGMGITDLIRRMKDQGIHVRIEACGKVMSAAVPILVSANERIVSKGTTFLIHPSTVFKFLASEQLKDIVSQQQMLIMARNSYAGIIADNSDLSFEDVLEMLEQDTWFTAEQALQWKMVDKIE